MMDTKKKTDLSDKVKLADNVKLDALFEPLQFETFLFDLFSSLVNVQLDEFDDKINHALQRIGRYLRADRCTLFHYRTEINA